MTSEASRESSDLDPVVRAVVETRAQQSGLSISDYLAQLILTPHHGGTGGIHTGWSATLPESSRGLDLWKDMSAGSIGARGGHLTAHGGIAANWSKFSVDPSSRMAAGGLASPALRLVMVFNDRIHGAALLMSAAFLEAAVSDFETLPIPHRGTRRRHSHLSWYEQVTSTCLVRSQEVRNALVHQWQPTARAERLAIEAFVLLSDLTPSRVELLQLCRHDRPRAFSELAKHLDLLANQFELSVQLLAEVEPPKQPPAVAEERRFANISTELLKQAGGSVSLTEGAKLLGISRQALHKRVKIGSALGMMLGHEIVLPLIQFVPSKERVDIIRGLSSVTRLFNQAQAGGWSALQFLIEKDPNLGNTPIESLRTGRVDAVVNAARAYLGYDEE